MLFSFELLTFYKGKKLRSNLYTSSLNQLYLMIIFDICVFGDDDICDYDTGMYGYLISSVTKTLFVGLVMVFSPGAAMEEFSQDFAEVFAKISGPSILQNIISCLHLCQFLHD